MDNCDGTKGMLEYVLECCMCYSCSHEVMVDVKDCDFNLITRESFSCCLFQFVNVCVCVCVRECVHACVCVSLYTRLC